MSADISIPQDLYAWGSVMHSLLDRLDEVGVTTAKHAEENQIHMANSELPTGDRTSCSDSLVERPGAYVYKELRSGEIRVLTLHPAKKRSRAVYCSLQTVLLSAGLDFEALSYCWGSAEIENRKRIWLDGHSHWVGANLDSFFRHRRRKSRAVLLWVDALCINQSDVAERSSQVALMAELYLSASALCIWLGAASEDSDLGMDVLNAIGRERRWEKMPTMEPQEIRAVEGILDRDWFHRTWVVQELVLGAAGAKYFDAYAQCGTRRLPWRKLEMAIDRLSLHNAEGRQTYRFVERILKLERLRQVGPLRDGRSSLLGHVQSMKSIKKEIKQREVENSEFMDEYRKSKGYEEQQLLEDLLEIATIMETKPVPATIQLLQEFRGLKAKDQRDKIYAMTWFQEQFSGLNAIRPDYMKPAVQLYVEFALSQVRNDDSLNILTHCRKRALLGLPTWVPDWSTSSPETPFHDRVSLFQESDEDEETVKEDHDQHDAQKKTYSVAPQTSPKVTFDDTLSSLTADGFIFDVVSITADPFVSEIVGNWENATHFMLNVAHCKEIAINKYGGLDPYGTRKSRLEAFWWSLFGDEPAVEDQAFPEKARRFEEWLPSIPAEWRAGEPRVTVTETGRLSMTRFSLMVEGMSAKLDREARGYDPSFTEDLTAQQTLSPSGLVIMGGGMKFDLRPKEWTSEDTAHYTARFSHLAGLCAKCPYDVQLSPFLLPTVVPDPFWRCRKGEIWETVMPIRDQSLGLDHERFALGRRFFVTEKGYMGLAPLGVQKQDKVVIFLGCDAPMILRERTNGYEVVGEAHVQGIMRGEAMARADFEPIRLI